MDKPLSVPEIARCSPLTWANYITEGQITIPPHLDYLNRLLVEVAAGRLRRLMVWMPPGHGKSETISKYFPAWFLSCWPNKRLLLVSYEANFAREWGRKTRDVIEEHGRVTFDVDIDPDIHAANSWQIKGFEGGMRTCGIGGAATGKRVEGMIIDDPISLPEDAMSPLIQKKHIDWYDSVANTRIEPGGFIIVLQTRWDRRDLSGQLIDREKEQSKNLRRPAGMKWRVVEFPALAKEGDLLGRKVGEVLWPERFTQEEIEYVRDTGQNYWWQALYQQDPLAARGAGQAFKGDWFEVVDDFPQECTRFAVHIDMAATPKARAAKDPDYTAIAICSKLDKRFYLQLHRTRQGPAGTQRWIAGWVQEIVKRYGDRVEFVMEQEPGSAGVIVVDLYAREVFSGLRFEGRTSTGAKESRIAVLSNHSEPRGSDPHGPVALVSGGEIKTFIDEGELFPTGDHDDMLDAAAGAVEKLVGSYSWATDPAALLEIQRLQRVRAGLEPALPTDAPAGSFAAVLAARRGVVSKDPVGDWARAHNESIRRG